MSPASLHLATTEAGDELLARDPLALVIGMLLDQQIPGARRAVRRPARDGVDRGR